MAKQPVIAVTNDGFWLSGKIGMRPFAIRIWEDDLYPEIGVGGARLFELFRDRRLGLDGMELLQHCFGSRYLTGEEKRILNSLLALAATIPNPAEWWEPQNKLHLFAGDIDDESTDWMDSLR